MGSTGTATVSKPTPAPSVRNNEENERGNIFRTDRTLVSKDQVDTFTKDYTPEMFLGDVSNSWTGSGESLRRLAEENAPKTLNIGGYTFEFMNNGTYSPPLDYEGKNMGKTVVKLEYQSNERVGNEYPVLQVGIRAWRTRGGKIKTEIIRDGYTNKTRFW